jgi:hypothetical protein
VAKSDDGPTRVGGMPKTSDYLFIYFIREHGTK